MEINKFKYLIKLIFVNLNNFKFSTNQNIELKNNLNYSILRRYL